jgi:hypothetical protein
MKDNGSATLHQPPNHRLFDPPAKSISQVLQRHQAAITAQNASTAPVINFGGAFDFLTAFIPQVSGQSTPSTPISTSQSMTSPSCLILLTCCPSQDMKIEEFVSKYGPSTKIIEKLNTHDYIHARYLCFIEIKELDGLGFSQGEIAALRDAVESWMTSEL